jgi:hypothetical protein
MKIRLTVSKQDKELVNKQYGVNLDWNLLSYCLTTSYNWIVPNRKTHTNNIRVALFHEFCHWNQYWIDDRSHVNMVTKRPDGKWGIDECEEEAQKWEIIGKKALIMYNLLKEGKELL